VQSRLLPAYEETPALCVTEAVLQSYGLRARGIGRGLALRDQESAARGVEVSACGRGLALWEAW
jgi:hypothetical protein